MPARDEKAIFTAGRQLGTAEARCAYLGQACGDDSQLRGRVEALLRIFNEDESFLQSPAVTLQTRPDRPTSDGPTVIGPYTVLEQIGEGGFGSVFLAEQQPIHRQVALKVIKPGMDTREVIARFEAERQALALMDHPNIARVFEAGTTDSGRPYFVMELVRGVPITEYCERERLPLRQRLELFVAACQGVQHAHQKGIIHRDLKPSNVLVTLHDGAPMVKIIDFGIAKAIGRKLIDKTMSTQLAGIVGTPLYMSPEQAEMGRVDIDTRADIYALGVILYELVTGTTPFDRQQMQTLGIDEIRRIIREVEPCKPSTRIGASGTTVAIVSGNRSTDAKHLRQQVRGELDWIVMKCLEKDRTRRFDTASGLARDIERYLHNEPVEAGPPSAVYKLRKFLARHKTPAAAAGLVLLVLVVGMAGTTWGLLRAEHARRDAAKRLDQIEKATEILASVFRNLDPQTAEKEGTTLHDLLSARLDEAARQLEGEAVGDPLVVARLQHALGISLRELGHLQQAEEVLAKACRTRERLLGSEHLDTAASKHDLAMLYRARGKYPQADALYKEVVAVRTAQLGADHADTLTTRHLLAVLYFSQGKFAMAEKLHKEVLAVRTAKFGKQHADTLTSQHWLGLLYRSQGKYAQAESLYKDVVAIRSATLGAEHLDTIDIKEDLAALYRDVGKYAEAEKLHTEVLAIRTAKLGPHHFDTLNSQYQLAVLYHLQEKFALAEKLHQEVLAVRTAKLGGDHPATLRSKHHLAALYRSQEKYDLAESLYREVVALRKAKLGAEHPHTLDAMANLAGVYWSMGKHDRSISLLEETFQLKKAKFGDHHGSTVATQADLGVKYRDAGQLAKAIPLLAEAYKNSSNYPELAWVGDALQIAYAQAERASDASAEATEQVKPVDRGTTPFR